MIKLDAVVTLHWTSN